MTFSHPSNSTSSSSSGSGPFSAEAIGTISLADSGGSSFVFECGFDNVDGAFVWFDDHLVCQYGAYNFSNGNDANKTDGSPGNPLLLLSKSDVVVRIRAWAGNDANASGSDLRQEEESSSVDVRWSIDGGPITAIDQGLLTTDVAEEELTRVANAESLARGWGLW